MPNANFAKKGDWNVICDRCGFKFKASKCRMEWDNLFVCSKCWEIRHPQDFLKSVPDPQTIPVSRPRPKDIFVPD
jgi:hypothetical protein